MNALSLVPAVLEFAALMAREGKPVIETAIALAKSSDDPAARVALDKLREAYEASDRRAEAALDAVIDKG